MAPSVAMIPHLGEREAAGWGGRLFIFVVVIFSLPLGALDLAAQEQKSEAQAAVEPKPQPVAQALILPSVPEVFRAMGKVLKPRWRQHFRTEIGSGHRDRKVASFAMGMLLCEVMVAAEARDAQHVRNCVQDVRECLTLLGLAGSLDARLPSIHRFAETERWPALRLELEALEVDFRSLLIEQMDPDLGTLIELGVWVRCLEVCSEVSLVAKKPFAINEPGIYTLLIGKLERMAGARDCPLAKDLRAELERLRRRWSEAPTPQGGIEDLVATEEKLGNFVKRHLGGGAK